MRIRSIKPDFWRDPDSTGRWRADLKLFYIGLWAVADDEGRFAWDEQLIAADLFPFDRDADVTGLLRQLVEAERVVAYESGGRRYGYLPKFKKHQRINRPTPSRFPAPPDPLPAPHGGLGEGSVSAPGTFTPGEDQGSGIREKESTASPSVPRTEDQVIESWNAMAGRAGLPQCRGGDKVGKTIRTRLKASSWLEAFKAALPYVEGSAWCRGQNDRGWRADLEWLLRDGNAERYAGRPPEASRGAAAATSRRRRVVGQNEQGEPIFEGAEV